MVNMFSLGRKPKIVRAGIFLQSQLLLYLKDNFPEMLIHQAENATIQNEVMIEHHHAGIQKLMTELLVKFQTIRNESVHLGQKRSDKRIMRNLFELNGDLRKKRNATNMKVPICQRKQYKSKGLNAFSSSSNDNDDDDDDDDNDDGGGGGGGGDDDVYDDDDGGGGGESRDNLHRMNECDDDSMIEDRLKID